MNSFVCFLDRFQSVYRIKWEISTGTHVVLLRLTKRQAPSRPDHSWPELWIKLARNAKLKEKHQWASENRRLDNARRLPGINSIDLEDKEFKETIKNARWLLLCLARHARKASMERHRSKTSDFESKFACILEASESKQMRVEQSLPNYHEDHVAGRADNSLQHYNMVHNFSNAQCLYSFPSRLKLRDQLTD